MGYKKVEGDIQVCPATNKRFPITAVATYFYDLDEELEEFKAVTTQVLPDNAVYMPESFGTDELKVAYKLLYSLLGNFNAFIKSGFSSGPGGESFDGRNFGIGPRDSGRWGPPVRSERGSGVITYTGHADIADVRQALWSIPMMTRTCGNEAFIAMLTAAQKGLDAILMIVFNHESHPAEAMRWKSMFKPTGKENRWLFPLMVGQPTGKDEFFASELGYFDTIMLSNEPYGFIFAKPQIRKPESIKSGHSLYAFERICSRATAINDVVTGETLQAAIRAACTSEEANAIAAKQTQVSTDGFAPLDEKVALTYLEMLAKINKCKWKSHTSKVAGKDRCPDAGDTVFPALSSEEGYLKDFNDLFHAFLKKHVPAVMQAALTDYAATLKHAFD